MNMDKETMWHKVTWVLESEKDVKEMRELLQICRDSGIYFDTGGSKTEYDWELDWSLEGGTWEDVVAIMRDTKVKWDLHEFKACICSEPWEQDNELCLACFPAKETEHHDED